MSARPDLSEHLCWLLDRASHSLLTELHAVLADVGLSPREHEVLVAARGGGHTQVELARMVGLDKTTLLNTLDDLEAAGLVERRPSPADRRVRVIAVTEAGKRKARKADALIHAVHEDVLRALDPEEREPFVAALQHLVRDRLAVPAATPRPVRRRRAAA